ncbi:solute carrier family 2, facilitated glucose transporter member 9-like [Syngnathoides biaculeatus]|uniref:solute carrier family 2, facilitated glucose transporter member 9-like n=1 Tax=Syngnathoides biaculeatus TaxID=300417 RepID=UPI002ADD7507|nr:solute carrier family 2, facilitated glucose transporter member 9-like [Syngnathoides biaculeatus]
MLQRLTLLLDCPLVIVVIFISGIGGTFQYGFGISVVASPSAYIKELVNQTCIRRYNVYIQEWQLSLIWSFTVSIFSIGGLLGSLLAAPFLAIVGRRNCLLFNNFVAITGAVLMLLSQTAMSFEMIMVGRFLSGINSGISLSAHSLYLTECTPKMLQAMVGVTIGTFIGIGKFSGQLLGLSELLGAEDRWPWLLGFSGFTAIFQLVTLPFLPESPKYLLLNRGDEPACEKAMMRLWGNKDHSRELEEMLVEKAAHQNIQSHSVMELIRERSVRWQLMTIIVTFISLQLSGINAVYFYSYDVFRAAGIHEYQLRYAALGMGMCEMFSSLVCFMIIDSTGKKWLLFAGYVAMAVTLVLLTITIYLQHDIFWVSYCSMVLIFTFLSCFSTGPGGVIAPLPGQIFTQAFKASAFTVGCTMNWTGMFVVGMIFPILVEYLDSFCFVVFLLVCLVSALFVYFNVPEMSNKTALEIAADFDRMHSKSGRSKGEKTDEQSCDVFKRYETKF